MQKQQGVQLFRAKLQVVEAMLWDGSWMSAQDIAEGFRSDQVKAWKGGGDQPYLSAGGYRAKPGDWVTRNHEGRVWIVNPATFAERYEPVPIGTFHDSHVTEGTYRSASDGFNQS